jgi:hypothetical protein
MNFPRCDEAGSSLILCRSVCENFFRACGYASYLVRCYDPEFYGAKEAEPETLTDELGLPIYMRAQLPGQPFRDLLVDEASQQVLVVCTPSIMGGAPHGAAVGAVPLAIAVAGLLATAAAALRRRDGDDGDDGG